MFILKKEPAAWWPVVWNGYSETEPGAVIENRLEVKFRRKTRTELKRLFGERGDELANAGQLERLFGDPARDREFFDAVVADWRGLYGEDDDKELGFEDPWITAMIELPGFMGAVALSYMKFAGGIEETRRGNSKASPAGGPETDPEAQGAATAGDMKAAQAR